MTSYNLQWHFAYRHPQYEVVVGGECFPQCAACGMQVAPTVLRTHRHESTKTCHQMAVMRAQHLVAADGACVVERAFTAYGTELRRVEQFNYLGRTLVMDDCDSPVIRQNISRAHKVWGRVSKIIAKEFVPPAIAGMFYQAVITSVLLFASKTWVAPPHDLCALEGFHVEACRRVTGMRPKRQGETLVFLNSAEVLKAARGRTIAAQILWRRAKIWETIADPPILEECMGVVRWWGIPPHRNWWEQEMKLDLAAEEEEDDDDNGC